MPEVKELEKHKPNNNPLASFAWFPPKVHFAIQDKKEKVVLLLRRHPVTNFRWILVVIILSFLPWLFFLLKDLLVISNLFNDLSLGAKIVFFLIWYLFVLGFTFTKFLDWYFNVYIVTTQRVIDIDFKGVLYKNISEAELHKIQDITHTSIGATALLFNYGELRIQTAAGYSDIEFEKVPNPSVVHKIIGELLVKVRP